MPKKAKRAVEMPKKRLWVWIIILIPLVVAIMWAISLILLYDKIPLIYGERASPSGVKSLISLVFIFIVGYGAFVLMEFRKSVGKV